MITALAGLDRVDQAVTAGSPTTGSSLKGAMVSRCYGRASGRGRLALFDLEEKPHAQAVHGGSCRDGD